MVNLTRTLGFNLPHISATYGMASGSGFIIEASGIILTCVLFSLTIHCMGLR